MTDGNVRRPTHSSRHAIVASPSSIASDDDQGTCGKSLSRIIVHAQRTHFFLLLSATLRIRHSGAELATANRSV
jgi:hypothetical protein